MVSLKKIIMHLLQRSIIRTSVSYTVPALSAGAKGYWTISGAPASGQLVGVQASTSNIALAANAGLKIWPMYVGNGNLYVGYETTNAIAASAVTITFYVTTYTA